MVFITLEVKILKGNYRIR